MSANGMFHKILVPLDGTELSEGILPYVSQVALGLDETLALLLVIDTHSLELPLRLAQAPQDQEAAREAWKYLTEVARRLEGQGIKAETSTASGKPAEEIVKAAEREGCGLIALSTHGRTALSRAVLGSVTDRVLHSSRVPTLTIAPERAEAYSDRDVTLARILVPLDGSPLAETVLPYVEELARKLSLEVMLVRVAQLASGRTPYSATFLYYGDHVDIDAVIQEECGEYLKATAETLQSKGLRVTWNVLTGAPAFALDALAREVPHDIVALATHGRSGMKRWALGSVAEAVVRPSGDPVLVVPPTDQD